MSITVLIEILVVLSLILLNGFLAMSEIAVLSARKARLLQHANEGNEKANMALGLANNPSDFLSTVQIGITLVGILTGAFSGATLAEELASQLSNLPLLVPYAEAIGISLVVVGLTYLSLVFGELVPKRAALMSAEQIAMAVALPMRSLSRLAKPLVRMLSNSTSLILRILRISPKAEPPVTEEEVRVLIDIGTRAGVFAEAEQDMLEGVLRLADRRVEAVMTPRMEIVWLDVRDPIEETKLRIITSRHSHFPVAEGSLDNVIGIAYAKDILARLLEGKPLDPSEVLAEPLYVPENIPAIELLDRFRETGLQIALVIDEFGGVQGLVTSFDILEAIAGEIQLAGETEGPEVVQREDGSWLIDGGLPVGEFREIFSLKSLPGEDEGYYHTLGGFIQTYMGKIPSPADHFEWEHLRIEVVDMDGMRVDKVMISPVQPMSSQVQDD